MQKFAAVLRDRIEANAPRLKALTEAEISQRPGPDRWSKKEVLGHLIDSACNNHQRFIRAQLEGELAFPGYEQVGWVRCSFYATQTWDLLVPLWSLYNLHLAHVIAQIPAAHEAIPCRIGEREPVPLCWVVEDYIKHLDHHLGFLVRPFDLPNV